MAGGINISIVSNVREFLKGTRDASGALDDVVDSLEDVAREGDSVDRELGRQMEDLADSVDKVADSGDKLERELGDDLTDVGKAADNAAEKMERSFRDAFNDVERESNTSTRKMGSDMDDWRRNAESSTGEFREEAKSNFSEITSSFTGDMDSMVDLAQGTFGGLAGTLSGPFGIASGVVAASAGLFYTMWAEKAEAVEQRVSDMYDDMIESGDNFLSEEYIRQAISDIITGADNAVISLEQVRTMAATSGIPEQTILAAAAGDAESLNLVLESTQTGIDEVQGKINEAKAASDGYADTTVLEENLGMWLNIKRQIGGVQDSANEARDGVELYEQAVRVAFGTPAIKTEQERFEHLGGKISGVRDRVLELDGSSVTIKANLDDSKFKTDIDLATRTRNMNVRVSPTFQSGLTGYGRSLS